MTRLTSHFREHDMHDVYQIIMINKDDPTKVDSTVDMLSNMPHCLQSWLLQAINGDVNTWICMLNRGLSII